MQRMSCSIVVVVFAFLSATCVETRAQGLDTSSPDLPADGIYVSLSNGSFSYPALGIVLNQPVLDPDVLTTVRTRIGNDEIETFHAVLAAVEIDLGLGPLTLNGPVDMLTTDRHLSTTGLFQTEIVFMSLSGMTPTGSPIVMRESPVLASTGLTDIIDLGGGLYHIDSFFDVFTELSVDGGQSWVRAAQSVRMSLTAVPEPSTLALLGLAAFMLWRRRR